ncbi:MAG: sugar phosphate isomerase/epimerase [Bryobacterales bacterium]|nr:sugar phosphate isomerase/epimerase [Bryobacterales bacterium]
MHRRRFFQLSLGAAALRAAAQQRGLDPAIIGANPYFPGYGLFRSIGILQGLGFRTIELHPMGSIEARPGVPPGFEFRDLGPASRERLKAALEPFRYVSTHLPWVDTPYLSPFAPSHAFGVERIDAALEASAFVGAELANIHVRRSAYLSLQDAWPLLLRTFRRWGDMARDFGLRLAIETGYPESVADFTRLVLDVDHEHVGATIDVGHQKNYAELLARVRPEEKGTPAGIKAYNDITHEIIDALGPKIFHFHVHDIEPDTWAEHKPLVHGFVDYPRLIAKLRQIDYQGLLVFEIGGAVEDLPGYFRDAKAKLEAFLGA